MGHHNEELRVGLVLKLAIPLEKGMRIDMLITTPPSFDYLSTALLY